MSYKQLSKNTMHFQAILKMLGFKQIKYQILER